MVLVWVTVTCDQAFFSLASNTKREEGPPDRSTYQCKPPPGGGGGKRAGKGWGFDQGIHLLSGTFDRVPLLGGRDI